MTDTAAETADRLSLPDPPPEHDLFITATALANHMVVATRNVRDFARFPGLAVIDPWQYR